MPYSDRANGFRLNSWSFPSGVSVILVYAGDTLQSDGATRSTSPNAGNAYPSSTTLASVANSLGRTLRFGFDTNGNPTVTDGARTLTGQPQTACNVPCQVTDPSGAVTRFGFIWGHGSSPTQRPIPYAQLNQVFTADNATSPNLEYDYDGTGAVYQVKDGNSLQIGDYTHAASGGRDPWTFLIDGPRTDVSDVQDFTWDADRRQVFGIEADPDGAGAHPRPAFKTTYDAEGHAIAFDTGTTTSATGSDFVSALTVSTTYDPAGNKIRESTPTRITQIGYDGANRVLCTQTTTAVLSGVSLLH